MCYCVDVPCGLSNKIPRKPQFTAGGSWSAVGGRKKARWKGERDGESGWLRQGWLGWMLWGLSYGKVKAEI